jgi:hypothetical protein
MRYRVFNTDGNKIIREGEVAVPTEIELEGNHVSIEVAPGMWLNFSVTEWGTLHIEDKQREWDWQKAAGISLEQRHYRDE